MSAAPSLGEQRVLFEAWFFGEPHQAYLAAVRENGGVPLDDPEAAFELYRRRWTRPSAPDFLPAVLSFKEINAA